MTATDKRPLISESAAVTRIDIYLQWKNLTTRRACNSQSLTYNNGIRSPFLVEIGPMLPG
jgi:hypothetical protein